jgi:hypothetical protein
VLITEGFEPTVQQQLKAKLQSDSEKRVAGHSLISRFAQCAVLREAMSNAILRSMAQNISVH